MTDELFASFFIVGTSLNENEQMNFLNIFEQLISW